MSEKQEQVKPLAPAAHRIDIDETDLGPVGFMTAHHRRCIKCCGCSFPILLILSTVILVLMFTVFHVKDPIVKIDFANIQGPNNNTTGIGPGPSMTFEAHIAIRNPNMGAFKFTNTTVNVYYDGSIIGETVGLAGWVGARKTLRMNVSVELMEDKISEVAQLRSDLGRGILPVSSYTSISGKVKIGSVVKRSFVVRLNCTMKVNMRSRGIEDQNCGRRVSL